MTSSLLNSRRVGLRIVQLVGALALASPGVAAEVTFQGLSTTSIDDARGYIENQIEYIQNNGATTARADDAAFFLQRALRSRGYDTAAVDWQLVGGSVVLEVNEGRQKTLETVNANGNTVLDNDGIRELVTSETRDKLKIKLGEPVPFVPADIQQGVDSVAEYYRLLGYKNASATLAPDPPKAPAITVNVVEGSLHQVGVITLPDAPSTDVGEAMAKVSENLTGKPYTEDTIPIIASELERIGRENGYYDTTATASTTAFRPEGELTLVDISSTANFGQRYKVARIDVRGNEKVKDRFFQRKLLEFDGNPYNPEGISQLSRDLLRTGAFKKVITTPEPQEDGTIILDVEVEEAKTRRFGPFIGFGTYEGGIIGVSYRDVNLFGLVRGLGIDAEFSQRGLSGDIFYNDKWFLWSNWELTLGLSARSTENEGYTVFETGLRAELRRTFLEKHVVTLFANTSISDISDIDIEEQFIGSENYVTTAIGVRYDYGLDSSGLSPHNGFEFGTAASIGIADIPFFRTNIRAAYHWPITKETTLSLGARSSAIIPLGTDDLLPIDVRDFSGGSKTIRSFRERDLGSRDRSGFPIGGEFSTVFNAQLEFPIPKAPQGLKGVVFTDAGNLIFDFDDAGLDNLNYAAGLGIRYNTPIGPLRIDYGYNLNRGRNEPSGTFHVGFGYAF